jgi:2-polyprenyl-3-methyl-5-hydroxy-6-metoxy-1,4-benzoquinol methylase
MSKKPEQRSPSEERIHLDLVDLKPRFFWEEMRRSLGRGHSFWGASAWVLIGFLTLRQEHLARYNFACGLKPQGKILDIACGVGYGSGLLAQTDTWVLGLDIDRLSVKGAKARYGNLANFGVADAQRLPFSNRVFDFMVVLETLEHVCQPIELLSEARRVLKPGGFLVVSTPNRVITSPDRQKTNPINDHHEFELSPEEFRQMLEEFFRKVDFFCQDPFAKPDEEFPPGLNFFQKAILAAQRLIRIPDRARVLKWEGEITPRFMIAVCQRED